MYLDGVSFAGGAVFLQLVASKKGVQIAFFSVAIW